MALQDSELESLLRLEWPKLLDSELESVGTRQVILFFKQRHLGPNLLNESVDLPVFPPPTRHKFRVHQESLMTFRM